MTPDAIFDVFLSYASQDKAAVEELARRLKRRKIRPFLDKWHLVPGDPWQEALEKALDQSRTFAVFIGPGALGPWQNEEMRHALDIRVRDPSRRVIPILLPGAPMPAERVLPNFLRRLTWVDFRNGLDDLEALRRLVHGIKGLPPGGNSAPTPQRVGPTMVGVPHRNPFFTGREELLSNLHQQLQAQGISALAQAAIYGLGGIGKTQTAIEYAYRFGKHYRFVLWAVAEDEVAIQSAYLSIARGLGLFEPNVDFETAILAVKAWLSREDGWLLVFDNADDPAQLRSYLPPIRTGGKVLLTSRARFFVKVGINEPFRIAGFEPKDAVTFLTKRTGNPDTQAATELATELGFLPLAIEQAAAYIENVGGGFADYLARYRRQGVTLFTKGKPSTDYSKTVTTTWALSFDAVRAASPSSAELLTAAAFLVPDSVPIEIFTSGGSALCGQLGQELKGAYEDPLVFWELLEPLERYSLVERLSDDAFRLHRLTQEVVKASLDKESQRAWAKLVVRALNAAYPDVEFSNWSICEKLQPHAIRAAALVEHFRISEAPARRLLAQAGYFANIQGDLAGARRLQEWTLKIRERVIGGEHLDTLRSRNNLAQTLRDLGDLGGAKKLHEENLKILERRLGSEHHYTLFAKNNLAMTLAALGDLSAARNLQEDTLAVRERVQGSKHPDTLRVKNDLAITLAGLGDLAGAKKLQEQVLEVQERVLGSEHPDTLTSRNNLAEVHAALGDFARARELQEQNLISRERVLGAEHPHTTLSTWNLLQTFMEINDSNAEARLIDKLRWLLDRDEGSIPSAGQRQVRQWLLDLLKPS